jgi:hypothetical protein
MVSQGAPEILLRRAGAGGSCLISLSGMRALHAEGSNQPSRVTLCGPNATHDSDAATASGLLLRLHLRCLTCVAEADTPLLAATQITGAIGGLRTVRRGKVSARPSASRTFRIDKKE